MSVQIPAEVSFCYVASLTETNVVGNSAHDVSNQAKGGQEQGGNQVLDLHCDRNEEEPEVGYAER